MILESNLSKKIQLALSSLNCRLFRNNVGLGWAGKVESKTNDRAIIKNPYPLRAGLCTGSSDLIGWRTVAITPEMVGQKVAIFTAIEVKTPKVRATKEQLNFINAVKKNGGIAGIARSELDAINLINPQRDRRIKGTD